MNIIEAIRSGKPFRRPSMDAWLIYNTDRQEFQYQGPESVSLQDPDFLDSVFLCDDWIVQPKTIRVTMESLDTVLCRYTELTSHSRAAMWMRLQSMQENM